MSSFEDELRKAMERREPGENFTARILARVTREESRKTRSSWAPFWQFTWQASYARVAWATALLLIFGGLIAYRQHVRAAEGRLAKEQLLTAIHIAGTQLHEAQLRVKRIEFPEVVTQ